MDASQCRAFDRAQNAAIRVLQKNLPKLNALSAKLASGEKLNRSEKALLARVEKYISGSGTSKGVAALASRGEKILGALQDRSTKVAENISQNPKNADARANSGFSSALSDSGAKDSLRTQASP
jgi:hypothetical protein